MDTLNGHQEHFQDSLDHQQRINGHPNDPKGQPFPSMEELEKELPFVLDGQVHLGLVMHQMVQDLYSQLLNIAET
jgi:mediator of RNA polymerase II transcription subunit 14